MEENKPTEEQVESQQPEQVQLPETKDLDKETKTEVIAQEESKGDEEVPKKEMIKRVG